MTFSKYAYSSPLSLSKSNQKRIENKQKRQTYKEPKWKKVYIGKLKCMKNAKTRIKAMQIWNFVLILKTAKNLG